MDSITNVAEAAYQGILAYISQPGNDMNGIQAQVIIASLKTTIIATGGLPPGAIQDPQQVPAAQLGDEMVQEGNNGDSGRTQSGVTGESDAGSGSASDAAVVVETSEDAASHDTDRSASSRPQTTANTSGDTIGTEPTSQATAVQASTTAAQIERATGSVASPSTASSASAPTNPPSSPSPISATSSSASTSSTASAPRVSSSANSRPTSTSASSVDEVTQVYSRTGCSETCDVPEGAFTGFRFENRKCFDVTNNLCKWLHNKAGPCADFRREFRIRTYDDHSGSRYVEPLFKIEPTASLKELAKVIKQKNVLIDRSFLEDIKWLVDYRCELTKRYLLVPTKRDSNLDKDNKKHQFFNKAIREVYEILLTLPRT